MKNFLALQTFVLSSSATKPLTISGATTIAMYSVKTGAGAASEVQAKIDGKQSFPMRGGQSVSFDKPFNRVEITNATGSAVTVRLLIGDADVSFGSA